jgi:ubiquitin carboxyl-terminal hydrolase 7
MSAGTCVHTFTPEQKECGFSGFVGLDVVLDPANGYLHNGTDLVLTVSISIQGDDRHLWDTRQGPGFVGLKNQGATCYMNSLLQTLFHLRAFRKASAGTCVSWQGAAELGAFTS